MGHEWYGWEVGHGCDRLMELATWLRGLKESHMLV